MDCVFRMQGYIRNAYKYVIRKPKGSKALGKLKCR